jgi:hypothetical protein
MRSATSPEQPGNPLKKPTDDEVACQGNKLKKLEITLFATTYADEVAQT